MRKFITAMEIMAPHYAKGLDTDYWCEAQHDIIYSHVTDEMIALDSEDGKRLEELGWHFDSDVDVWACFT